MCPNVRSTKLQWKQCSTAVRQLCRPSPTAALSDIPDQTASIQMSGSELIEEIRNGGFSEASLLTGGS
jgi:hypothetical protein